MRYIVSIFGFVAAFAIFAPVVALSANVSGSMTATQTVLPVPSPSPSPTPPPGDCTVSGSNFNFASVTVGATDNQVASATVSFACTGAAKPLTLAFLESSSKQSLGAGGFTMVNTTDPTATIPFFLCLVGHGQSTCDPTYGAVPVIGLIGLSGAPSPLTFLAQIASSATSFGAAAPAPGNYSDTIIVSLGF
ncbi:MAG: hypothetical protein NVSMB31_18490 [Vulcanimicrobiaceae bacterium]